MSKKKHTKPTKVLAKRQGPTSSYTPEIGEYIIQEIAEGRSLASICREEGMPDRKTVRRWRLMGVDPAFVKGMALARQEAGDLVGLSVVEKGRKMEEIAAAVAAGQIPPDVANAMTQALRAAADADKWAAARMNRDQWGDKAEIQHDASDRLLKMYGKECPIDEV